MLYLFLKTVLQSGNRTHGACATLVVAAHVARAAVVEERAVGIVLRIGVGLARPVDVCSGLAADLLERFVEAPEPGVVHFYRLVAGCALRYKKSCVHMNCDKALREDEEDVIFERI